MSTKTTNGGKLTGFISLLGVVYTSVAPHRLITQKGSIMGFNEHTLHVIKDAKHRLGNKITVKYIPSMYKQGDFEDEWICLHPSVYRELATSNYMTADGPTELNTTIQICEICDEVVDDEEATDVN